MKLVFATHNKNKAREIAALLPSEFEVLTLSDLDLTEEIPETSSTLEGNARQKAAFIHSLFKLNCFADDTGLEVNALNNEPGVFSARYAGSHRNDDDNMNLLLSKMMEVKNRSARFRTVISLILNNEYYEFEGIAEGEISSEKRGSMGFGYDPIFIPKGYRQTFAEMNLEEKNRISHRSKAFTKMIAFLSDYKVP